MENRNVHSGSATFHDGAALRVRSRVTRLRQWLTRRQGTAAHTPDDDCSDHDADALQQISYGVDKRSLRQTIEPVSTCIDSKRSRQPVTRRAYLNIDVAFTVAVVNTQRVSHCTHSPV